jgi:hypothetical protein
MKHIIFSGSALVASVLMGCSGGALGSDGHEGEDLASSAQALNTPACTALTESKSGAGYQVQFPYSIPSGGCAVSTFPNGASQGGNPVFSFAAGSSPVVVTGSGYQGTMSGKNNAWFNSAGTWDSTNNVCKASGSVQTSAGGALVTVAANTCIAFWGISGDGFSVTPPPASADAGAAADSGSSNTALTNQISTLQAQVSSLQAQLASAQDAGAQASALDNTCVASLKTCQSSLATYQTAVKAVEVAVKGL